MATTLSVEDCIKTCSKFCKVVEKSFGPRGELSFIISCTGQGQFTTSGMAIMENIQLVHPAARIILQTLQRYYSHTGDGSKTFVLLLNEVFVQISEHNYGKTFTNDERIKLIQGFNFLLHSVLPDCFMELRNKVSDAVKEQLIEQSKDIFSTILCLLKTFFSGKFSSFISDYLSDLVHSLLVKHSKTWKSVSLGIKQTLDNFDVLCSTDGTVSLSESKILPGVVLSREFTVYSNSKATKHLKKFMVMCIDNPNEVSDATFSIKNDQQIYNLVQNELQNLQMLAEQKKQKEISLIISSGKASDCIKALCRQYGIELITMVPKEEINYLLELSQVQPVRSFKETISEENCGIIDFVRTVRIQNKDYAHLGLKCKNTNCFPYHLILNGPTDRICKQYLKEIWSGLKLIHLWKTDFDRYNQETCIDDIEKDYKDGLEFTHSARKNTLPNNHQEKISPDQCYSDCLENTVPESPFSHLKHCCISDVCQNFMICPAGGCWELYLHYILSTKKLDDSNLITACRILSKALVIIPRTLYTNNCYKQNRFPIIWKSITEKLHLGNVCYLNKWGEVQTREDINVFEPVISKEMLISQMIQLVLQLLRLQSVIATHKS